MKSLKSGLIILAVIIFLVSAYFITAPKKQSVVSDANSSNIKLSSVTPELNNLYNFDEKTNLTKSLGQNLFEEIKKNNLVNREKKTLSSDVSTVSENLANKVINDSLADFKLISITDDLDVKTSPDASREAKSDYFKAISQINKSNFSNFNKNYLQVIVDTYQKIDPSSANSLADVYKNIGNAYLNLMVPSDWTDVHKMLIVYAKNSEAVYRAMADYPTDPIKGYLALETIDGLIRDAEKIQTTLGEKIKEIGS